MKADLRKLQLKADQVISNYRDNPVNSNRIKLTRQYLEIGCPPWVCQHYLAVNNLLNKCIEPILNLNLPVNLNGLNLNVSV